MHLTPPPHPRYLRPLSVLRRWFCYCCFVCFMYLTLFVGFCVGLCFGMHYFMSFLVLQSSCRVRESWLLLCFYCLSDVFFTVDAQWLFLTVTWVGLQCVIVVFPHYTHLLFWTSRKSVSDTMSCIISLTALHGFLYLSKVHQYWLEVKSIVLV